MTCLLCGFVASHNYENCRKYPGQQPTGVVCPRCNGQHPGTCLAVFRGAPLGNNGGQMQQFAQPHQPLQPMNGLDHQPQQRGAVIGNHGVQPLPQTVLMNTTQAESYGLYGQ